tara:strand:- start:802 stop:1137 length:336 start_codon:yes stop_codon:yes gene_type:complete
MSKNKLTREQLYAVKKYYKNLFKTNADGFNGIKVEDVNLYMHPHDEESVYIRYKVYEIIGGQSIPRIVSVCVNERGKIGDCFTEGSTLKEKVTFEQDLHKLDLSNENIKVI